MSTTSETSVSKQNQRNDETEKLSTASIVTDYIRTCIKKKRRKLTDDQIKYLLPTDDIATPPHILKLIGYCIKSVVRKHENTIKLMEKEWADVIEDIHNVRLAGRMVQIQFNMLMRHWLVEDGRISWDRVIMCIAFTTHQIKKLLKQTLDPFRSLDLSRWCIDFITSYMGHFISKNSWDKFFEKETDWFKKETFDISFVQNPRLDQAFIQRSSSNSSASQDSLIAASESLSSSTVILKPKEQSNKESQTNSSEDDQKFTILEQQVRDFQQLTINFLGKQELKMKSYEDQLKQAQDQVMQLHRQHLVLQQKLSQMPHVTSETRKADSVQYMLTPMPPNNQLSPNNAVYPTMVDPLAYQQGQQLLLANERSRINALNHFVSSATKVMSIQPSNQQES